MNDIRYIQNPFAKIFNVVNPDKAQLFNLLLKLLDQFFKDIKLPTVISRTSKPQKSAVDPFTYAGTGGYLYMLIRLYDFFNKKQQSRNEEFSSRSFIIGDVGINQFTDPLFYLHTALDQYRALQKQILSKNRSKDCFSFYMSEVSVWLCGMHLGFRSKNVHLFRVNEQRIIQCFKLLKQNIKKQFWQLLYGVPGFLYAVVELQKHYDKTQQLFQTKFSPISIELTNMIIKTGISNYQQLTKKRVVLGKLQSDFRLVYYFHKKQYLGGAHGLGGNISVILSAMKYNDFGQSTPQILELLKSSIVFLLKHHINGNFSTSAGSQSIKLVHFCHGAPGIVTALAKFTEMFPQIGIIMGLKEVIENALNHIWKFGVLKKGFGLCHGISGNAYSFISPSLQQVFHDKINFNLKRAQFFALLHEEPDVMKEIGQFNFQDRMSVGVSDQPYSLMIGIAGDICFTMDVIRGSGYFPGYDI